MPYSRPVTRGDDVMSLEEFKEAVKSGCLKDYDGFGYPVKDGRYDSTIAILPSLMERIPADATHILWFNR
jgi:hypothetical protein